MSGKRLAALIGVAVIVLSVVLALVLPKPTWGGLAFGGGDAALVVRLSGSIQESGGGSLLGGGGITPQLLRLRLRQAEQDPSIKAVVLRMNTGGGTVGASQEMAAMVRDFPKPVVVSMGDITASGGYYIASQADAIVAQPGTLTGSIGVIWTTYDVDGLLEKLGVELETVTAGEHKDMFLPGGLTAERRALVQALVDTMYEQFVMAVAQGREGKLTEGDVRRLATGELYTGEQALALGLVDHLGGLPEAVAVAAELAGVEELRIVEPTVSFWEQLAYGPALGDLYTLLARRLAGDELALLQEALGETTVPRYGG